MAVEVITKKWGNSIGVVIPNKTIEELNIKPDQRIVIDVIKKENPLRELFGALKLSKPANKIVKEARKELESKWG